MRQAYIILCYDCATPTKDWVSWGDMNERCQSCSDARKEKFRLERERQYRLELAAKKEHTDVYDQTGKCPDDGEVCENCCLHDARDGGWCLICDTDVTQDLISQAEYFEGDR